MPVVESNKEQPCWVITQRLGDCVGETHLPELHEGHEVLLRWNEIFIEFYVIKDDGLDYGVAMVPVRNVIIINKGKRETK